MALADNGGNQNSHYLPLRWSLYRACLAMLQSNPARFRRPIRETKHLPGALAERFFYTWGTSLRMSAYGTGRVAQPDVGTAPIGIVFLAGDTIKDNVYWDMETTGATEGGGTLPASNGFTTAQMSNPASFDTPWDFSATDAWAMPAGTTHPVLRWQLDH
jgi:hypothetical protein